MKMRIELPPEAAAALLEMYKNGELQDIGVRNVIGTEEGAPPLKEGGVSRPTQYKIGDIVTGRITDVGHDYLIVRFGNAPRDTAFVPANPFPYKNMEDKFRVGMQVPIQLTHFFPHERSWNGKLFDSSAPGR